MDPPGATFFPDVALPSAEAISDRVTSGSPAEANPHFIKFLRDGSCCELIVGHPHIFTIGFVVLRTCYSPRPVLIIFHPSLSLLSTSALLSAVMPQATLWALHAARMVWRACSTSGESCATPRY